MIERDGRVLVARRPPHKLLPLKWEFPGGKVEPGEAPEAALAREVLEELGCTVHAASFVARSEDPSRPLVLDAYRCALVDGEPRPDARDGTHDAVRWIDREELAALAARRALAPLDVPLAEAFLADR